MTKGDSDTLPLEQLETWVTPATFEWLKEGDAKAAELQAEMEAHGADQISNLFGGNNDSDDDISHASDRSDADFEGSYGRIRVWTSSSTNINGVGSRYMGEELDHDAMTPLSNNDSSHSIRIVYIISESWEGY